MKTESVFKWLDLSHLCCTMVNLFYPALIALFLCNRCIMGLTDWPDGKYGLLKPKTGCPEEWAGKSWEGTKVKSRYYLEYKGWTDRAFVFQVTEETFPNETLNFDGHIGPSFVMRYFCVKRTEVITSSITWPPGKYCIHEGYRYQYQSKKKWGRIRMFDKGYSYDHATKYVYDFAREHSSGITLSFSCQISGNKKIPISLPITKPFYLLPYGSRDCQQVQWMVATSEWIKYHTLNYDGYKYWQKYRTVPYHELGNINNKGITMYYCHYESCNYTLTDKEGVFQSPGFPGQYPDGQLCSWRIMVPDNYTLRVHFTHFSLTENDKLQFFKMVDRSFILNNTFYGNKHPNLTATNDVEFVFNTDTQHNSSGFRAHYRVFIPTKITTTPLATTTKEPTTTSKTTTTTQPTTTTKPPTTKAPTNKPLQTNTPTKSNISSKPQKVKTKTNKPTRKVSHTTEWKASNDGESNSFKGSRLFSCDTTSNIIVIVIPLLCCILVIALVVDIVYRCRYTKNKGKSEPNNPRNGDCLAVNMTYERGDIIINQPADTVTDASTVNTVDDQPQSRDEPPDYEDVDYTQLNDIPPPRRSSKRQEYHPLEPVGTDPPDVFYHVLEPPNTESGPPQSHTVEPVSNGAPDVFYHVLEPPTGLTGPCYQNMSDLDRYTINPLYESSENSAPLVEANKLYDNYMA